MYVYTYIHIYVYIHMRSSTPLELYQLCCPALLTLLPSITSFTYNDHFSQNRLDITHMYLYMHMYIYTYMRMYIRIYIHTYIHTLICMAPYQRLTSALIEP